MFYSHEGANRAVLMLNRGGLSLVNLLFQSSSYLAQIRCGYGVVSFPRLVSKGV